MLAAIDELNAKGYSIEPVEIAETELVMEGVSTGRFPIAGGANNVALRAIELGAPLKLIVDRNANEWTVGATADIQSCSDLSGKRIAIHSPGAVSSAMLQDYIENNCPEIDYEPLVIAGSQNRLAALLAGQIDASPLELGDWIALSEERPNDFRLVANFAESLPNLRPSSVVARTEWAEQNPDVVKDVIRELLLQHRRIADEPDYLYSLLARYLPEEAAEESRARRITDTYRELGIFDVNGGLTREGVEYTAEFFGPDGAGITDRVLEFDEVADLSYLEEVLGELGRR